MNSIFGRPKIPEFPGQALPVFPALPIESSLHNACIRDRLIKNPSKVADIADKDKLLY